MTFVDERLSQDIEQGAKRRPRYSTDVVTADGGWEVRNERWRYPLFAFDFNFMPDQDDTEGRMAAELAEIDNMFHVVGGSAGTFLFRDWRDWRAVDQVLGVGDGSNRYFQLYRNYTRGSLTRRRLISRPIEDTIEVRVDGAPATFTHQGKGLLLLTGAPNMNAVVAADFDFNLLTRFESDELEYLSITGDIEQPVNITLLEVREEPEEVPE